MLYKTKNLLLIAVAVLIAMFSGTGSIPSKVHAANLTVNQPSNGQTFSGNDFEVAGVAEADSTIVIVRNGLTIKQTRSDSNGNWSATLQGLPDGDNQITVRSIKNSGFGYFVSTEDSFQSMQINQFRFSDNVINPSSPFPIAQSVVHPILIPSSASSKMIATGTLASPSGTALFDTLSPADPVTTSGYPSNRAPNVGAFSADGSEYFSIDIPEPEVTVIDVATNTVIDTIPTESENLTAWRGPNNKIYAIGGGTISIINAASHDVEKTVDVSCGTNSTTPSVTFSQDDVYPFYYSYCIGDGVGEIYKLRISDDQIVDTYNTNFAASNGVLNADNSRLYVASSAAIEGNLYGDKITVFNTSTGAIENTITTAHGVVGLFQSPDLQHLYAATPGSAFDQTGIDVIDMYTDEIERIETDGTVMAVTSLATSATLSNVSVAVVLGVKTTTSSGGQLAKTGVFVALASPFGLFLVAAAIYTYVDYRRHRAPLVEADAIAQYSYWHHLRVVTVPLVKYRLSVSLEENLPGQSDKISRY